LETDSQHQVVALQGELDRASTRLRAYEVLEEEVDDAVMRAAALEENGLANSDYGVGAEKTISTHRLVQTVRGIPCNPERRVRQAVFLAQRLMATEKERDVARARLADLQAELVLAQERTVAAEENLTRSAQPTTYLVSKLRDEERLKLSALTHCRQLEADLKRRKQSQSAAVSEAQQLRERLFSLLEHRGELETVKSMVRQLCEVTTSAARDDHPLQSLCHRDGQEDSDYSGDSEEDDEEEEREEVRKSPSRNPSGPGASPVRSVFGLSAEMLHRITSPPHSVTKGIQQMHQQGGSPNTRFDSMSAVEFKDQLE
jgi:hypothetical protein